MVRWRKDDCRPHGPAMTLKRKKIGIGFLRLYIDTVLNHYMYDESDHLDTFRAIYLCGEVRRRNRPLDFHQEPLHAMRLGSMKIPFFSQKGTLKFLKLIKEKKIGLLYAELIYDAIPFLWIAKESKLPLFINFRGGDFAMPIVNFFFDKILARTSKILTRSRFQKKILIEKGVPAAKINVFYGGVDTLRIPFKPRALDPCRPKLVSAGRYIEKKGFDATLKFFAHYSEKTPGASLTLIAEGLTPETLKRLVPDRKILGRIRLLPFLPHKTFIKELYNQDIFLLLSQRTSRNDMEGIPNVLKEAMASGMPVLSTRHSGIPELIENARTGHLVEEGDFRDAVKKIPLILNHREATQRICLRARSHVERYFDIRNTSNILQDYLMKFL
jgi:glycosyltransferase involved in cell wall biosynthesis